jgi:hypothetical protein
MNINKYKIRRKLITKQDVIDFPFIKGASHFISVEIEINGLIYDSGVMALEPKGLKEAVKQCIKRINNDIKSKTCNYLLKKYYIEIFKKDFDPEYEYITESQKEYLQNSTNYIEWIKRQFVPNIGDDLQ